MYTLVAELSDKGVDAEVCMSVGLPVALDPVWDHMQDTSNNQADRLLAHRWYAAATLMPDGRILVTSGQDTDSNTGCAAPLPTSRHGSFSA